jgi:FixJ family two-component response regulator
VPDIIDQPIYLVDQDDVVRDSLKVLLESHGLHVQDFRSPSELLRSGDLARAGCLILGFNRHIMDGVDFAAALHKRNLDLPIIFIVGGGDASTRAATSGVGAFAHLERPVREATLIRTIRDALALSSDSEQRSADTARM